MSKTIHLGYTCPTCGIRVPVYSFSSSRGIPTLCTPPTDQVVTCPTCNQRRHVRFAEIERLERWEEGNAAAAA